ncbi:MAG: dihydroorotate dehydrogenase [Chloroflexi bacterium RBG_19FT_COMBO_50_10]|nr:MAG: dihydroorotate dehydrogenase [Chloroflexi bacterium RBG_19FT_COMBO_50_10]
MADLTTTYLGLKLKNPLVASPSPLSEKVENVKRMEEAGIAAVVLYSLFEEQIIHESLELDHFLNRGTESFAEALTYFPNIGKYSLAPDRYIEALEKTKRAVNIPVMGSLNGVSTGGWIEYARKIQDAGADALELNLYYLPTDFNLTSNQIEDNSLKLVSDIRTSIEIPLAVKLAPFFTALPYFAKRLVEAGAAGIVLFNRFYQPDLDLENLEVVPNLVLSSSDDLRLPLRWIAILYGKVAADLALTSGVHTSEDALKAIMAGATVAMSTSALLKRGTNAIQQILTGMEEWMSGHEYESITQMRGSMSQGAIADPAAFERANYMKVLNSFNPEVG